MVCALPQKLNLLFSFLRTHPTTKMIVFMSSCKQVRSRWRYPSPLVTFVPLGGPAYLPGRAHSPFWSGPLTFLVGPLTFLVLVHPYPRALLIRPPNPRPAPP